MAVSSRPFFACWNCSLDLPTIYLTCRSLPYPVVLAKSVHLPGVITADQSRALALLTSAGQQSQSWTLNTLKRAWAGYLTFSWETGV